MAIHAKRGISASELMYRVDAFECGMYDIMYQKQICEDIKNSGIEFDCENIVGFTEDGKPFHGLNLGAATLASGVNVIWVACGGDWEFPVAACLYLGKDGLIHLYAPKSGNVYNRRKNSAYGNNGDFNCTGYIPWYSRWRFKFNMKKLMKDASNNITFTPLD